MEDSFIVIGGDKRLCYAARELEKINKKVTVYGNGICDFELTKTLEDAVSENRYVLCGIPFSRDNGKTIYAPNYGKKIYTDELLSAITPHHMVFAGMGGDFLTLCAKKGAKCFDYNICEDFLTSNAHLTAEALVAMIINNLPISISEGTFLILGYGRIGKALSDMLKSMGGKVTACARKESDFALMRKKGIEGIHTDNINTVAGFDCLINTIPFKVTNEDFYKNLNSDCVIIDASASPGYIDTDAAKKYQLNVIGAFGLPGKISPASAGKAIVTTVNDYIAKTNL
jgi:dipicolinate synthase subunit A